MGNFAGALWLDAGVAPGLLRMCAAPLPSSSRRRPRPREKTVPDASAVRSRPQVASAQPVSPGGLGVGDPLNGRFPAEGRLTEEEALVPELGVSPAPSSCIKCEPARPSACYRAKLGVFISEVRALPVAGHFSFGGTLFFSTHGSSWSSSSPVVSVASPWQPRAGPGGD